MICQYLEYQSPLHCTLKAAKKNKIFIKAFKFLYIHTYQSGSQPIHEEQGGLIIGNKQI